ncbi:putative ribonuclease H-like domain-containing protein, partial [Tanacetum coccineum]
NTVDSQVNIASPGVNTGSSNLNTAESPANTVASEATHLEYFNDEDEPEVNLGNIPSTYTVPTTPHTRVHINHPLSNVIRNIQSSVQARRMKEPANEQGFLSDVYDEKTHEQLNTSWVEAMQEELLQFEQKVWILVDLPKGKRPIGLKWIFKNKTDERGIFIRNKARLVTQGYTQEEGIDYDDVFGPVARIEAIRLFLAYASFMRFMVYQMDVKSAFLYGTIEEEVYVCQPPGFEDPDFPDKVYKVVKALYGLHQAPRACKPTLGLWYARDSSFELVAYTDIDYAGATQDRKSTTGGCQFLGSRLISWQCKKQTIVATSTTEAEYVAAASCYLLTKGFDAGSTASLDFCDKHNMVAFLEKSTGSEGFHQVIDFLNRSHIQYALTRKPEVYVSFIKQIWRTAEASTGDNREVKITAIIDGQSKFITEASLRRHLKLEDHGGIDSLPNSEIFEQLALMGYHTDSDKLTF